MLTFSFVKHICWLHQTHNFVPRFFTNLNTLNNDEFSFLDIDSQVQLLWDVQTISFLIFIKHLPKLLFHQCSFFAQEILTTIQGTTDSSSNSLNGFFKQKFVDPWHKNISIQGLSFSLMKGIFFFFTKIVPFTSTSNIWLSSYDFKRAFK